MADFCPGDLLQGSYRYLLNGEPAEVNETWSRRLLSPGTEQVSSRRTAPGVEIAVTAELEEGVVGSCEIEWISENSSIFARYVLNARELSLVYRPAGGNSESETMALRGNQPFLLFPLMRIFTGGVIAGLLYGGGRGTVILPSIGKPEKPETLLRPLLSERQARVLQMRAELEIEGVTVNCRLCEYTGDQYGADSRFWLGEDSTLLRYQWRQGPGQSWDVWLQRDVS
jgi:hypothetical protein